MIGEVERSRNRDRTPTHWTDIMLKTNYLQHTGTGKQDPGQTGVEQFSARTTSVGHNPQS